MTDAEADVLAGSCRPANTEEGGADFVVTAPFGEDALLTLTGEVDYADQVGRAQAVTNSGGGGEDDVRTGLLHPPTSCGSATSPDWPRR